MWDSVGGMQDLGFGQAGEVNPSEMNDSGTVAGIFQTPRFGFVRLGCIRILLRHF
jgi:hypothetical protein